MTLEDVITEILAREGGGAFTNDAQDQPTKWGITLAAFQEHKAGATLDALKALDEAGAREWYRWRFAPFAALKLDRRAWVNLLDAVTMHGPTGAIKAAQQAAGVLADGQLGPKTQAALAAMDPAAFCLAFAKARWAICVADIRRDLIARFGMGAVNDSDLKYAGGWVNRILDVAFG